MRDFVKFTTIFLAMAVWTYLGVIAVGEAIELGVKDIVVMAAFIGIIVMDMLLAVTVMWLVE